MDLSAKSSHNEHILSNILPVYTHLLHKMKMLKMPGILELAFLL